MPNKVEMPLGFRNNNPGNLRRPTLSHSQFKIVDGYCVFRTMQDGLDNLARQVWLNYMAHGLKTPHDFAMRYAPPSENDTHSYAKWLALWLRLQGARDIYSDMHLDKLWPAIDVMRAVTIMEMGHPPPDFSVGGEWFSPRELVDAWHVNIPEPRG